MRRMRSVVLLLLSVLTAFAPGCKEEPLCELTGFPRQQLRLLNAREYRNTVRDLLPATESSCVQDTDCNLSAQSCVGDVCVADPCSLHTFLLPSEQDLGTVHVAGDFNGWPGTSAEGLVMTWAPDRSAHYAKAAISDGTWQYKFVVNGSEWIVDPANPQTTPDGFGGNNSVLIKECDGAAPPPDGALDPTADFPVTARSEGYPFDNDADSGLVTSVHVEQYLAAGAQLAALATDDLSALLPCEADAATCPETWARSFLRRAYRRPPTDDEVSRSTALISAWPSLEQGFQVAIQVALSSPSFLYRSEIGESEDDGTSLLTQHEIATLLSYTYLATTPDEALLDAADANALATPEQRAAQARRLLALPGARDVVREFGVQWLGVTPILTTDKSSTAFPEMTPAMRAAMLEETARVIEHVVFDGSGSYAELMTSNTTFANDLLAAHYELEPPPRRPARARGAGRPARRAPGARQRAGPLQPPRPVEPGTARVVRAHPASVRDILGSPPGRRWSSGGRSERHHPGALPAAQRLAGVRGLPPVHRPGGLRLRAIRRRRSLA